MRSITILGCNICSQITVAHVTLPKAVLSTVKLFAVQGPPDVFARASSLISKFKESTFTCASAKELTLIENKFIKDEGKSNSMVIQSSMKISNE